MTYLKTLILLLAILVAYLAGKKSIRSFVQRIGRDKNVSFARIQYIQVVLTVAWTVLAVISAAFVIGIGYQDVGLFFGSMFAVVGVALFAQWSILSNVTSSVVIFFFFPFRVGDSVKIMDGDNTIEGNIKELTLFHIILESDSEISTYPNAMIFQKAVKIAKNASADDIKISASDAPTEEPKVQ